jgi:hypothetical protein
VVSLEDALSVPRCLTTRSTGAESAWISLSKSDASLNVSHCVNSCVRCGQGIQHLWLHKKMRTLKSILVSCLLLLMMIGDSSAAVESRKIDEINNYNWEELMLQLDFCGVLLQNEPAASAYIIVYDGRHSRRGEVQGWMDCIKNYLVERRGMDSNRIMIVNGGYRRTKAVELWLVTPADTPPKATPTVKPKDVRFRKGILNKRDWGSLCAI